jgi:eukaryotic-like serine/threonine-protein kinase
MKAKNLNFGGDNATKVLPMLIVAFGILVVGVSTGYGSASDSQVHAYPPDNGGAAPSGKILVWVDREGNEEPISVPPDEYRHPQISPDGMQVALSITAGPVNKKGIWILSLASTKMHRLTDGMHPIWSPDGKRIVYWSHRNGKFVVLWKAVDGSGKEEQLASAPDKILTPWCWSHDGKALLIFEQPLNFNANTNIAMVSMGRNHGYRVLLKAKHDVSQPQISPDGRWIAFTSDKSGQNEVHVCPYPQIGNNIWQISQNGGDAPLWSPDGRELFFRNRGAVVAVSVKTNPALIFEKQRALFRGNYLAIDGHTIQTLEISPDAKRFLMIKPAGGVRDK